MVVYGYPRLSDTMEAVHEWHNILEELLQCSVCLEIPQCPIVQCTIGHHICMLCRNTLQQCPICKHQFLQTRNFAAEDLILNLERMKLSIQKHLDKVIQMNKKITTDAFTQTDFEKAKICSATQTIEKDHRDLGGRRNKEQIACLDSPFRCLIGYCMFCSNKYEALTKHVRVNHKDAVCEVDSNCRSFSEKCILSTNVPQEYNYVFLMNGMDLFFFNIIIQFNGTLQTKVQHIGVDLKSAAVFHYDLRIANEKVQLHRHGKVIPCMMQNIDRSYNVYIYKTQMFKIIKARDTRSFECIITIKDCFCKARFAKGLF